MAKTKSESSGEILRSYLNPAVHAAREGGGAGAVSLASGAPGGEEERGALLCSAHFTLAEYLANLYASVKRRVESPEWHAAGRVAESRKRELSSCRRKVESHGPRLGGV